MGRVDRPQDEVRVQRHERSEAITMTAGCSTLGPQDYGYGGNALEHWLTRDNGEEIVVRLDNGALFSIVQRGHGLRTGDRVRVLTGPSGSRVERG
jgi:outer membrane lipoprotein SlyB